MIVLSRIESLWLRYMGPKPERLRLKPEVIPTRFSYNNENTEPSTTTIRRGALEKRRRQEVINTTLEIFTANTVAMDSTYNDYDGI